jgi:uncharacterized protein (DUF169 family)
MKLTNTAACIARIDRIQYTRPTKEAHPRMTNYQHLERELTTHLGVTRRPIAISFCAIPPVGVERFSGTAPSGCSFWRLAGAGRIFYTVPTDHANCAIGAYTHAIPLPPERAGELEQTLTFMAGLGYVKMAEVPAIARLAETPGAIVYAPLGETPVEPDIVLVAGRPGRVMLLQEAALRAGVAAPTPLLARPTCMALPAALAHGVLASTGCVGNRVYTDLGDDELYVAVPGQALAPLMAELGTISTANATLREYHRQRRKALATA